MADDRKEILDLYKDLRVADVRDGLDWNMMHFYGTMTSDIKPLYRTRAIGIARTVRYLPFQGGIPHMSSEEYTKWSAMYYKEINPFSYTEDIEPGDFIVIDQSGLDVGLIGSNSGLNGIRKGAVAYVCNGGVRDTDELVLEKVPFWCKMSSQPMVQARMMYDAKNVPVCVGGVTVKTGDVVVADGDGVVVVPRAMARQVANYALQELKKDKVGRRKLYEALGMKLDETVL
jgi:4-hydroxy-4-methyl-2-oxoglutarate aldolase